jgi:hypothetical protein
VKFNVSFGGPCHLHHQGWRVSQARNQGKVDSFHQNTWRYISKDRFLIYK